MLLELIVFWCLALLLALSASAYFVQWRNGRRFVKLLATVGSLLLMGLILLLVVPDTYDRALGRYETESGSCYVVDNQSKQGGVTLWFEEASYDFRTKPDVLYGPGTPFDCTVTLTKVQSTGVDYELQSDDGEILFSTY